MIIYMAYAYISVIILAGILELPFKSSPAVGLSLLNSSLLEALFSLDSWMLDLIPFVKADCDLNPAKERCNHFNMTLAEQKQVYYQGERLSIPIKVSGNCEELNEFLISYGEAPLKCEISNSLFPNSLSYTPHSSGLLKYGSVKDDVVSLDYTPSSTLVGELTLTISIYTVNNCATLSGNNCLSNCIHECESIETAIEQKLVSHSLVIDLVSGTDLQVRNTRNFFLWVFLSLIVLISLFLIVLCVLRKRCKGLIKFPTIKTVNSYPGIDLTADQPSYSSP